MDCGVATAFPLETSRRQCHLQKQVYFYSLMPPLGRAPVGRDSERHRMWCFIKGIVAQYIPAGLVLGFLFVVGKPCKSITLPKKPNCIPPAASKARDNRKRYADSLGQD